MFDYWKVCVVDSVVDDIVVGGGVFVFVYCWDWDEGVKNIFVDYFIFLGVVYGMEIVFVMGDFDCMSLLFGFYSGGNRVGCDMLLEVMMSYWIEFVYNGDLGKGCDGELFDWNVWGELDSDFIVLDIEEEGGLCMMLFGVFIDDLWVCLFVEINFI